MDESFKGLIEKSRSILILLPVKPNFDQAASGMSLFLSLRAEKEVQVYSPSPVMVEFNRIIGINKITSELGNKNLIIEFSDYKATDIERVSYDINNGQFKLTVIPKQKILPPTKENVVLSYSGISSDTVIMIGGVNETHFPAVTNKELAGLNIAHIGTKDISLPSGKSYISFARPCSSVSEIVAGLIKESGMMIDEDIATNLLMGIENATNFLEDGKVTADTFLVLSDLLRLGGRRLVRQDQGKYPLRPFPQPIQPKTTTQTIFGENPSIKTNNKPPKDEAPAPSGWLEPKIYKGGSVN